LPPRLVARLGRDRAIEVVEILPGSPAAVAGLRPEDLIVEAAGVALRGVEDLHRLMTEDRIGRPVDLTVVRGREERRLIITPRELTS
ncbi:MAG TPA: PDZ domain-containing protein, partial [Solirubrobacteraceae bacterium]|nr:PDZ domain-containing protein [Solirubrobacteraceae bacterium]